MKRLASNFDIFSYQLFAKWYSSYAWIYYWCPTWGYPLQIKQIQQCLISTNNKENKFCNLVIIDKLKLVSYSLCWQLDGLKVSSIWFHLVLYFIFLINISYQNIQQQGCMDIKIGIDSRSVLAKRKYAPPSKRPASQFASSEQPQQHDPKQYRILIHCFFNNINNYFAKRHKSLLGDLQDMYKIPLNKEERFMLQDNIQGIIERNVNKLARDAIFRNSFIAKNIGQYFESFQKFQKMQSQETDPNLESAKNQQIQQLQEQTHFTLKVDSYKEEKRQRPFSSNYSCYLYKKAQDKATPKKAPIFTKKVNRNNIFNQQQFPFDTLTQNQENQDNEVGDCCVFVRQNCRRFNRLKVFGKSERISQNEMLVFQEEQGKIVDQNNNSNYNPMTVGILNFQTEKNISHLCKQGSRRCSIQSKNEQFQKSITKTNLNRFFNLNLGNTTKIKSIDQMQKQKIQNRILSMNGSLSTNITKPQGYKAKSKCWGSATPSNGKLSYQMMKERQKHNGKGALSMVRYK